MCCEKWLQGVGAFPDPAEQEVPNKSRGGGMVSFDAPFYGVSKLILGKHNQSSHENPDFSHF